MTTHTIKYEYDDGKKLAPHKIIYWCGRKQGYERFNFMDAQHLALAVGGSIQPCKNCVKAIIRELKKELD